MERGAAKICRAALFLRHSEDFGGNASRILRGSSLGLHRKSLIPPRIEPALECVDVLIPALLKFLRQTGAGGFVRSGTVGDYGPVLGDARETFFPPFHGYSKRPRYFRIGLLPRLGVPGIENRDVLARIQAAP